jgi:hypothetical protein
MSCNECKYWVDGGHFGTCKRYPTATSKAPSDWCGEFNAKVSPAAPFIPAVTSEELGEVMNQVEKRRGRPPKGEE